MSAGNAIRAAGLLSYFSRDTRLHFRNNLVLAVIVLCVVPVVNTCAPPTVTCSGTCTCTPSTTLWSGMIVQGTYANNLVCTWTITASTDQPITLKLNSINTEYNNDFVRFRDIYTTRASYSGTQAGDSVVINRKAIVEFVSDLTNTGTGFSISWFTEWSSCACNPGYTNSFDLVNLARACSAGNCPVTQSSIESIGFDGSKINNGNYGDALQTQEYESVNAWTMIDMEEVVFVDKVRIWNRADCCYSNIDNFQIRVGNSGTSAGMSNTACVSNQMMFTNNKEFKCVLSGRYLTIQRFDTLALNLAEVEVFGLKASQRCNMCVPGKYKTTSSTDACTTCPAGTFSITAGASALSTCMSCGYNPSSADFTYCLCPVNQYWSYPDCAACTSCGGNPRCSESPSGSVGWENCVCSPGFTGPDHNNCVKCAGGKYKSVASSSVCTNCPAGKYSTIGASVCTDCPAGTYSASTGATDCQNCSVNTQSLVGSTALTSCLCSPGFTGPDHNNCVNCAGGKYKSDPGFSVCTDCPVGKYSILGSSVCTDCPDGKFSSTVGASDISSCIGCGSTQSSETPMFCLCAANQYWSDQDCAACNSCDMNPPCSESLSGSVGRTSCVCSPGFTGADHDDCVKCTAGKYKSVTGSSECTNCTAGKYSVTGASVCKDCPAGKFSITVGASDDSSCISCGYKASSADFTHCLCAVNEFWSYPDCVACNSCGGNPRCSESLSGSVGRTSCVCSPGFTGADHDDCVKCTAGKYKSVTGSSECTNCTAGMYSGASASVCINCIAGQYSSTMGASVCSTCLAGSFSLAAASVCGNCVAGKYSGTSASVCINCIAGQYSSTMGASVCSTCLAGSFSLAAASVCSNCVAGKYSMMNASVCTDCPAGTYYASTGATDIDTCQKCPANSLSLVGSTALTSCVCNLGFTGPNGGTCNACAAGKYKTTNGTLVCTDCGINTYSPAIGMTNVSTCQSCPIHTQSQVGSTTLSSCVCNFGYTGPDGGTCNACPAGKYKTVTGTLACEDCDINTYSTAIGETVVSNCQRCPIHAQSPAGSTTLSSCVCNVGYIGPDGGTCNACVAGKYKTVTGNVECTNCRANTYSLATGATTIDTCQPCSPNSQSVVGSPSPTSCVCNLGFTGADGGTCNLCAMGTFKSTTGSSDCLACARGKFGDSLGASACTSCAAGKFSEVPGATSQAECSTTLRVLNTSEARAAVRVEADTCAAACQPPFVLLRERLLAAGLWGRADVVVGAVVLETPELPSQLWGLDAERTCVRCAEDACGVGRYPAGVLCQCRDCDMDEELDALPAIM